MMRLTSKQNAWQKYSMMLVFLVNFGACLNVSAAPTQIAVEQHQIVKPPKKHNKDLPENHAEKLKDFTDTPRLPRYSEKCKFIEGVVFPAAQSGPSITMKFAAKSKPEDVLTWYKNSFDHYKWTVEPNATQENRRIGATKDKDICRIMVTSRSDPQFKTMVVLTYRFYQAARK